MRRAQLAGVTALAVGISVAVFAGVDGPARAATGGSCTAGPTTTTCVFAYTGGLQTFTVPTGVTSVTAIVAGGQGGSAGGAALGGLGGESTATLPVTSGSALSLLVGSAGSYDNGFSGSGVTYGGGGSDGGNGSGSGGGGSFVFAPGGAALLVSGGGGALGFGKPNTPDGGVGGGAAGAGATAGGVGAGDEGGGLPATAQVDGDGGAAGGGVRGGAGTGGPSSSTAQATGGAGATALGPGGGGGGGYFAGGGGAGRVSVEDTIAASGGGGSGFAASTATSVSGTAGAHHGDGSISLTYALQSQTVRFTSTTSADATVDGPTYTPTTTGGASGNPVVVSIDGSSTTGACTLADGTVSFTGAGTCVLDANQAGDDYYTAAPQAQQTITVGQGSQTISFSSTPPTDPTVDSPGYTPTADGGLSGNPVVITVDPASASVCTLDDNGTVSFTAAGTCTLDANQAGDLDYTAAPQAQQTITVGKQIVVGSAPTFGTGSSDLPAATVGTPYSASIVVTGNPAPVDTVTAGMVPTGLTLTGDPVLSGTPSAAGRFTFTLTSTNAVGHVSRTFTVVVAAAAPAPATAPTAAPTSTGDDGLPFTGFDAVALLSLGVMLVAGGSALRMSGRRRRQ